MVFKGKLLNNVENKWVCTFQHQRRPTRFREGGSSAAEIDAGAGRAE